MNVNKTSSKSLGLSQEPPNQLQLALLFTHLNPGLECNFFMLYPNMVIKICISECFCLSRLARLETENSYEKKKDICFWCTEPPRPCNGMWSQLILIWLDLNSLLQC